MSKLLRALTNPDAPVRSIAVHAKQAADEEIEPAQFRLLVSHLLDRFFNNDVLTVGGETLPLIMTIAGAIAVPTLICAVFAYPPYHAFPPRPPVPPFWGRTAEHLLYVVYSLVAMGAVTVFEADMLFPNLLDILVLSTLPIPHRRLVLARVCATLLFLGLFLVGINSLGILAYPAATEFHVKRMVLAHFTAVMAAGLFSAAVFLALQGVLICLLSGRSYRVASVALQGVAIAVLLAMLLLFPAIYPHLGLLIEVTPWARYFPPFWFLGVYEHVLGDPAGPQAFTALAHIGWSAVSIAVGIAAATYPLAYLRRTRQAVEGLRSESPASTFARATDHLLHATVLRMPVSRAIYHFIGQTVRMPRHRVYLAMYAGLGVALMLACTVTIDVQHGRVMVAVSGNGLRWAVPGVAFWAVSGLYSALLSPADSSGGWVFRVIGGDPTQQQLHAVRLWVKVWGLVVTVVFVALLPLLSPLPLRGTGAAVAQVLVAVGVCILLPDVLLFTSRIIPFTESRIPLNTDLAFVLLRYVAMFPVVVAIGVSCGKWMEQRPAHLFVGAAAIVLLDEGLCYVQRHYMEEQIERPEMYQVGTVLQTLGLRE